MKESVSINAEALLEDRCTECHGLDRTTQASKLRDEWDQTVVRMIDHGAELNDEERTVLVDYLAQTYGP
jgi:transposase-like protein